MKTYRVKVLKAGQINVEKSILTRGMDCGTVITVPVRMIAIENDDIKMIVDTGISEEAAENTKIEGVEIQNIKKNAVQEALETIGWSAGDVNMVINTHLHFGNCGNNGLFNNAKVYVQKKEWEYAQHPSQNQIPYYDPALLGNSVGSGTRLELIDGEYEIAEGLILLPTPGHSRGHQSLLVNTEEGVVCCAGHAVNLMENLKNNVIGNVIDVTREAFDSIEKIKRTSKYIIPGYDTVEKNKFPETHC